MARSGSYSSEDRASSLTTHQIRRPATKLTATVKIIDREAGRESGTGEHGARWRPEKSGGEDRCSALTPYQIRRRATKRTAAVKIIDTGAGREGTGERSARPGDVGRHKFRSTGGGGHRTSSPPSRLPSRPPPGPLSGRASVPARLDAWRRSPKARTKSPDSTRRIVLGTGRCLSTHTPRRSGGTGQRQGCCHRTQVKNRKRR
jgi:hypothetical protein